MSKRMDQINNSNILQKGKHKKEYKKSFFLGSRGWNLRNIPKLLSLKNIC